MLGVGVQPSALQNAMSAVASASWRNMGEASRPLAPFLWAYMLGSTLGALLLAAVAYQASLTMIVAHRRHQALKKEREHREL
jgi:hypothetical protein